MGGDNKAEAFKSHLDSTCTLTAMGNDTYKTSLNGTCGVELFYNKTSGPGTYLGSDWICENPFTLLNATIISLYDETRVFVCTFS